MANKRMFTMHIVDSDAFLDMPLSSQCLYFHLNMRADDDGFIGNPKRIQKLVGASEDDLKLLIAKRFVLTFEDGVIVIKHWRMHNTIRGDRYTPTAYQEELAMLGLKDNKSYTLSDGNQVETSGKQIASTGLGLDIGLDLDIEKDIDIKDSRAKSKRFVPPTLEEVQAYCKERNNQVDPERFVDHYTSNGWMVGKNKMKDWKSAVRNWEKGDKAKPQLKPSTNKFNQYPQRSYSQADYNSIEAKLLRKELAREV